MKNIFIIFATVFNLGIANAATGFIIDAPVDSVTNSSCVVLFNLMTVPANYKIICNFGTFSDTSATTSGAGVKLRRVTGLSDGTNYVNCIVSILSGTNDTLTGTFNVTTLATPTVPNLTATFLSPNKLRITGSTNHPMYVYAMYGIGSTYNQTSNTFFAKPGSVDDTLTLVTNAGTAYNYIIMSIGTSFVTGSAASLAVRFNGSFMTPSPSEADINNGSVSWGIDTANFRYYFSPGYLLTGGTIATYLFDSVGVNPLKTISSGVTPNVGMNSVFVNGLIHNTYYRILVVYTRGTYKDSVWVVGRTIKVLKPFVMITNSVSGVDSLGITMLTNIFNGVSTTIKVNILDSNMNLLYVLPTQNMGVNFQNKFSKKGLTPNTMYYVQIIDSNMYGKDSIVVMFQTLPIPPPTIGNIIISTGSLTARSVTVSAPIGKGSNYPTGFNLYWVTITPNGGSTILPVDTSITAFPVMGLKPIIGLKPSTTYTVCFFAKHDGGVTSVCIPITTLAPKPAPVISTTPVVESSCASVILKSFPVTVASGDLGTVFVYGREGKTDPFVLLDQKSSNTSFVYQGYIGKGFKPNTYYQYMMQTMSMDSSMSSQLIVGDVTINSTEPQLDTVQVSDWLIGQYYVTPKIFGHAGCDNYKFTYLVKDMSNKIVKTTWVNVSGGMFNIDTTSLSGLTPGTQYYLYCEMQNAGDKIVKGPQVFKTLSGTTSGIENQNTSKEELWNDESSVTIYDMLGQNIFAGTLQDARLELVNKGTLIAVKQITNNTQKRQVKKFNF